MKSAFLLLALAAPLAALADSPDSSFYKNAAEAGIAEVDAGNLAQDKGTNQQVKDFAAMMVKDHTTANDKLKTLAGTKSIDLPSSASMMQMAAKTKLNVLSGDSFDKAYVKNQINAHRQTIALFRKEIKNGQDPDAKAFAQTVLPTLQGHMKKIDSIASGMGIASK